MQTYIGVKMIQAEPMSEQEFQSFMEREPSAASEPDRPGYHVVYDNYYHSWSPKEVFENAYFPVTTTDTVMQKDALQFVRQNGFVSSRLGDKTAVAQARCVTGFEVTKSAAALSSEHYTQEIGDEIALSRIKDQLVDYLAFVFDWARNGLKGGE